MNILIVSRYCEFPSFHGSAQHVHSFSNELIKNNHNVEVVTGENVGTYKVKYYNNIKYHIVPIDKTSNALDSLLSSTITSKRHKLIADKIFTDFSPTVIHFGAAGKMLTFLEQASYYKIPTVAMMHDFFWVCLTRYKIENNKTLCSSGYNFYKCGSCIQKQVGKKSKILNRLSTMVDPLSSNFNINKRTKRSLNKLALFRKDINVFIAQTKDHIDELKLAGVNENQIKFISQGLSKEKLHVKSPNKKINKPIKIGYFGRVSKEKNVGVFVKALNLLSSEELDFHAVFVANGMTKDKIEEIANEKFSENISLRIFGELKEEKEVSQAISDLDVCVITSSTKESPRCLLESLAQKVPCVIADILGNNYLIKDHFNGRLFEYNNPKGLKTILKDIIINPSSLEIWRQNIPSIKSEEERTTTLVKVHEILEKNN